MDWRERAIHERFERRVCSQCGAPYAADAGVVVAHRGNVYILLASCDACQHRALFLVSFPHHRAVESTSSMTQTLASAALPSPAAASSPTILPASGHAAVTTADVEQVRRFLDTFDGDFRRLFGER